MCLDDEHEDEDRSMALTLTPADVGLPAKFTEWRTGQDDAIERIMAAYEEQGFQYVALSAPVGSGKTAEYVGLAMVMGWRVCVLTATKGLQDQLLRDFGGVGLVDIRGRGNYECSLAAGWTCEDGAHARCSAQFPTKGQQHQLSLLREDAPATFGDAGDSCPYRVALKRARGSRLVVTNYTYWMLAHLHGDGLGDFDLLVLDEAHEADQQVCGVMRVEFTARRVYRMLSAAFPRRGQEAPLGEWQSWARDLLRGAMAKHEALKAEQGRGMLSTMVARELSGWASLVSDLETVAGAVGAWGVEAIQTREGSGFALEPLRASQYARRILFISARRHLLVSATVRPKTLELLGLGAEEVDFQDYPYLFPIRRSPVYFLPTAWVQHNMSAEGRLALEGMVDSIIRGRMDRRGLMHTVSYQLRDDLKARCKTGDYMLTHARNSEATRAAIELLREAYPPVVLSSPSIATGVDFPYSDAEYQIIPKLPFPPIKGSAIMEARCHKRKGGDPEYSNYLMVQKLSQMLGRPMRAADDRCETFILDCNFFWVQRTLRNYFPSWVRPLIQKVRLLPNPPPALYRAMAGDLERLG